jgi:hypothetical protein
MGCTAWLQSIHALLCCAVLCCAVLCCAVLGVLSYRRECEKYALACANPDYGNLCFASAEEADAIETVRWPDAGYMQSDINQHQSRWLILVVM